MAAALEELSQELRVCFFFFLEAGEGDNHSLLDQTSRTFWTMNLPQTFISDSCVRKYSVS